MKRRPPPIVAVDPIEPLTRTLARGAGIPELHLSAVVERAKDARWAAVQFDAFDEIGLSVLVRRVVDGAAADHARGLLERRCS